MRRGLWTREYGCEQGASEVDECSWKEKVPEAGSGERATSFQLADGEQPVVSRLEPAGYASRKDVEPPRYEMNARREETCEDPDESSDEGGFRYPRIYPGPEYVAARSQVQLSDTVLKLSAKTVRTTTVLGIPLLKRTVEASDSQDWTRR